MLPQACHFCQSARARRHRPRHIHTRLKEEKHEHHPAGLCLLLLPLATMANDHPTAECSWLYKRIEILETAIRQGDELGTRESWQSERKSSGKRHAANMTTDPMPLKNEPTQGRPVCCKAAFRAISTVR